MQPLSQGLLSYWDGDEKFSCGFRLRPHMTKGPGDEVDGYGGYCNDISFPGC